jgi:hypothetical protein
MRMPCRMASKGTSRCRDPAAQGPGRGHRRGKGGRMVKGGRKGRREESGDETEWRKRIGRRRI